MAGNVQASATMSGFCAVPESVRDTPAVKKLCAATKVVKVGFIVI
jgi:hypothetical protein